MQFVTVETFVEKTKCCCKFLCHITDIFLYQRRKPHRISCNFYIKCGSKMVKYPATRVGKALNYIYYCHPPEASKPTVPPKSGKLALNLPLERKAAITQCRHMLTNLVTVYFNEIKQKRTSHHYYNTYRAHCSSRRMISKSTNEKMADCYAYQ